jgi:hypothetical protein
VRKESRKALCRLLCMPEGGIWTVRPGVQLGQIVLAEVKREKMSRAIVRRSSSHGNIRSMATHPFGEVPSACPPGGGFTHN